MYSRATQNGACSNAVIDISRRIRPKAMKPRDPAAYHFWWQTEMRFTLPAGGYGSGGVYRRALFPSQEANITATLLHCTYSSRPGLVSVWVGIFLPSLSDPDAGTASGLAVVIVSPP